MKKLCSIFVFTLCCFWATATGVPGKLSIKTEKDVVTGAIKVILTPLTADAVEAGDILDDVTLFIVWNAALGPQIDLDGATLTSDFGMQMQNPKGTYLDGGVSKNCRNFSRSGAPGIAIASTWPVGVPVTILTITPLQNGTPIGQVGDFSIMNLVSPGIVSIGGGINVESFPNVALIKSTNLDDYYPDVVGFAPAVPLPIELLTFDASATKKSILLGWRSAFEQNFKGFEIQRSMNGKDFEKISFIKSTGRETGAEYAYEDLVVKSGIRYYYRLKMLDLDGEFSYSLVTNALIMSNDTKVNIYPNPSDGNVNLEFFLEEEVPTQIDVYDMIGKIVMHRDVAAQKNKNIVSLDFLNLPSGLYSVQTNINGKKDTKMVKIGKN